MKKVVGFFLLFLLLVAGAGALAWMNRTRLISQWLSTQLGVPVAIRRLDVSREGAHVFRFWVGNPPRSRTTTAFAAEEIEIDTTFQQLRQDPLTIDRIEIDNIFVGLEYYNPAKTESNWGYILGNSTPDASAPKGRDYLIRKLILNNLTVEMVLSNGKVQRFPTIARMEFNNISSETGFPVSEIEKAIFNLMIQDLIRKLPIDKIIEQVAPKGIPLPKWFN
jgi:hypothetical protein